MSVEIVGGAEARPIARDGGRGTAGLDRHSA
jgi:hypothetical protein